LVETDTLVNEPYSSIIGYPRCSSKELESRIKELQANNVNALLFEGNGKIGKLELLGKGHVSVVVKAIYHGREIALKIRRTDADRTTMEREGEFLRLANRVGVGPKFIKSSRNFLLMDLVKGINIYRFVGSENSREKIVKVVRKVLEQCYRLDSIGLDHGELSDMRQHVIVGKLNLKVTIIDFESASVNRRVSNVTAATQYLFIGGAVAKKVRKLLKIRSIDPIISSLRNYKSDVSKENLEGLKQVLNL
jgi:putative serine/threonine protein kinase